MATVRQIAANRANSEKSTGPTTDAGKAASRANALSHGLTGAGVVLPDEDADAVHARMVAWRDGFQPATVEDEWLFEQLVVSSVRVDRCHRHESELRTYEAGRARSCWDEDRQALAEETAAGLARNPSRVVARLTRTRHGSDWLVTRWRGLAAAFDGSGSWTEAQQSLALDLLGTPAELRGDAPALDPPAVAAGEVARLERLRAEGLDDLDDFERGSACDGLAVEPSRALLRLRRYEAACLRQFHWARDLLRRRRTPAAAPSPAPAPAAPALPAPATRFEILPPVPEPSAEDWHAEERAQFDRAMGLLFDPDALTVPAAALLSPEPAASAPAPAVVQLPPVASTPTRHVNRRARRAALKRAGKGR